MRDDLDWAVWSRERQQRVEHVLDAALPAVAGPAATLTEAMRYAVLGGGKRVRPLLAYAAGEFAHADVAVVDAVAAAVEMIHAYSLIHDDLPAWTTTRCAAAADGARRVRRGDGAAGWRRAAGGGVRRAWRGADARRGLRLCEARRRLRRCGHGGRAGDRPRRGRAGVAAAGPRVDASDEDRRADPRGGGAGAMCGPQSTSAKPRRSSSTRMPSGSRSRSSTTCSTSPGRRLARQDRGQRTRRTASRPTSRCSASTRRSVVPSCCAWRRTPRSHPAAHGRAARRAGRLDRVAAALRGS